MTPLPLDPEWRTALTVAVFVVVYLGMFLGGLPRLRLDRTGVAVLGAIAMIAIQGWSVAEAAAAIDLPTIVLLFAFMVVSAQMRLGGFYTAVTRAVGAWALPPPVLLGVLLLVVAVLSAVFSNDVVCLAVTPIVARIAWRRGWDPVPWLVAVACASNIGSAATLIGNPQNMLIGSVMQVPFGAYVREAGPPVLLALLATWGWMVGVMRRSGPRAALPPATAAALARDTGPAFDRWQSTKGLAVAAAVLVAFLFTDWPREVVALVAAGVLLLSRRLHSAEVMGLVDWPLLLLFIGLFIVNHGFEATGLAAQGVAWLAAQGLALADPVVLAVAGVTLSNLVSNVPAVMLILPHLNDPTQAVTLALVSTYAGNLLLVGSIANLIVADLAGRDGLVIDWRRHAAIGVPVTAGSLLTWWAWQAVAG
ncbi:anion transporter [Tepidimonas taiwanensis]|uniref:Putative transporter n=1 Tax=Tepidimonas taiwanensis TaxID=307486 RepID=A0A554X1R5_9BURK|nr:SLC13 family permease [Tepidimonas taiwanensis]TSE29758.1 putative transporter [Tepidimonas taiwanensis]UBQ04303.1 anion transporter [Tepidimonas taiwanensis]